MNNYYKRSFLNLNALIGFEVKSKRAKVNYFVRKDGNMNNKKDYKFRYRITSELSGKVEKPVEDYFKEEIMNLLNIVIVTSRGREMKIDGFKFVNDPKKIIPLK